MGTPLNPTVVSDTERLGLRISKTGRLLSGAPRSDGKPPHRTFRRATYKQIKMELCPGVTRMDVVADALVSKAETGDMKAIEFLHDVIDGPLEQQGNNVALGLNVTVQHATVEHSETEE